MRAVNSGKARVFLIRTLEEYYQPQSGFETLVTSLMEIDNNEDED